MVFLPYAWGAVALSYHYFPASHWSRVISLALAEKDLEPERHVVDIRNNATLEPEYMRLNPRGVVPTLVDDGTVVWDSLRIAAHLDGVGGPRLHRRDDPTHARWMDTLEDFRLMHLSYSVWVLGHKGERSADILADKIARATKYAEQYPDLREAYARKAAFFEQFSRELHDDAYMERCLADSQSTLDAMERAVTSRPWLGGEEYGLADAIATSILYRIVDLQRLHGWHSDPEDPLRQYYDRLCARASFAKVFLDDPQIA